MNEHNARVHFFATCVVLAMGAFVGLSPVEWGLIIAAIASVWLAEAINSAIERVSDTVTTEIHPLIAEAKDLAAAAVLVASMGAAVIGALVFFPHFT